MKVSVFPYPCQHLPLSIFFVTPILVGVEWHFCVVLIWIFLSHWWYWVSFHVFIGHCISSLEKCLFRFLCPFLNWCWFVRILYVFWIPDPIMYIIWHYFLPFCRFFFHFLSYMFWSTETLNFNEVLFPFFILFFFGAFCVISNKLLPTLVAQNYAYVSFWKITGKWKDNL